MMSKVLTVKLVNGDEIIGRMESEGVDQVTLSKPVLLAVSQKGLGFAPICISVDDASSFTFKQEHVLFTAPTRKELEEQYIKATTGIQLATSL